MNNFTCFTLLKFFIKENWTVDAKASVASIVVFICIFSSISSEVAASTITHINVGRVVVEDQSLRSQQNAGKKALEQVFIKISGSSAISSNSAVDRAIDNYEQYMISSSFQLEDSTLYYEARFNQQKIESLLLASGLPVWTNIRPSGIVWLAYNTNVTSDPSKQFLVTQNTENSIIPIIKQSAFARGVDLVIPLGDFEDAVNVTYFDVANHFLTRVRDSSIRYQPDYIISASLERIDAKKAQEAQRALLEERNAVNSAVSERDPVVSEPQQLSAQETFEQADLFSVENVQQSADESLLQQQNQMNNVDSDNEQASLTMSIQSLVEVPIPDSAMYKMDYVIARKTNFSYQLLLAGRLYGETEAEITKDLIDIYANTIALEFSLSTQDSGTINQFYINVANIDSLQDHMALMELFNSIPAIDNVALTRQKGALSTLKVEQKISISQLISILSLDNRVSIVSGNLDDKNSISIDWQQ